jgi:arsenite methyltransferase
MTDRDVRKAVRRAYGKVAREAGSCCGSGPADGVTKELAQKLMGYTEQELALIPEEANLGLGCGNPTALASLEPGEVVLDLGSGAGMDCFLAAERVGPSGRVIGVDMTPEMIDRARENAEKNGFENVEFRLGEIEHLPVADSSVDRIISNCVINLSPDKPRVFREAFRVLRSGGQMLVSDIVLVAELPADMGTDPDSVAGCITGAMRKEDYLGAMREAGFREVDILKERPAGVARVDSAGPTQGKRPRQPRSPQTPEDVAEITALIDSGEVEIFATSITVHARKA